MSLSPAPAALRPSPAFTRVAAACAGFYVLAQTFQELAYRFWLPAPTTPEQELLGRLLAVDQARAALLLLSFFGILVAFAAVALFFASRRPAAALLGFVFGALFAACELCIRSVDLFLVSRRWASAFATAAPDARSQLLAHAALWDQVVASLYFALLAAHLVSSLCFALASFARRPALSAALSGAFALNALRLLGRILESFAGQSWLSPVNEAVYFPATFLIFGTLTLWLVRAGSNQLMNASA